MKFLSVRDLRAKSAQVWRDLTLEREMVVTNHGRPVAVLVAVNEGNLETSLTAIRRARAVEAVAALQNASARQGNDRLTGKEIDAEIKAVRRIRRR